MATSIGIGVSPVFQLKKAAFHSSLVDAWFMSGYSNSDKPKEIVGVRGNAIVLNNFLYSDKSGFNEVEGSLMFDGVDDYAECNGLPILEDYTVICRRKWLAKPEKGVTALASKRASAGIIDGAFNLERMTSTSRWTVSYGSLSNIVFSEEDVIYQTTLSYNGSVISRGTAKDTPILILGEEGLKYNFAQCAIAYFALYSRTLTTQEIEEEKIKLEQKWKSKLK